MKTYKDIYEFPLRVDEWGGYIFDSKNQMVAQFEIDFMPTMNSIIDILNKAKEPNIKHHFEHNSGMISEGKRNYILIRGWGNLTGTSAHNLPEEEAANIQDTFAEFIVERLNSFKEIPINCTNCGISTNNPIYDKVGKYEYYYCELCDPSKE